MKRGNNVIRNPRKLPVTFVSAAFMLVFLYIVILVVRAVLGQNIQVYSVGNAESDNVAGTFSGIILRNEEAVSSEDSGYAAYFVSSGDLLKKTEPVMLLTENDDLEERLHKYAYGESILSDSSDLKIQNSLKKVYEKYDPIDFSTARALSADIRSDILKCFLDDGGENILSVIAGDNTKTVSVSESSFILLWRDDYTGKSVEDLTAADLEAGSSKKLLRTSGDYLQAGDFAYTSVYDNKFSICFLLTHEQEVMLTGRKSLTVRMNDEDEITGSFEISTTADGQTMGILTFKKYSVNYLDDRYVSFRILNSEVTGYKIPESCLVHKDFYVVPDSCIVTGTDNALGVIKKTESGTVFVKCTVYRKNSDENRNLVIGDDVAYIYSDNLKTGDTILAETEDESGNYTQTESVIVSTASVDGVYQVNAGYAVFKPVLKLTSSIETSFCIVSSELSGTVRYADRIIMNPENIKENEIVFE